MSSERTNPPELGEVLAAYGFSEDATERVAGGLINATFRVTGDRGRPIAALQNLHPIFRPEVNLDIEAVTAHLQANGLETPRLIRTRGGRPWVEIDGGVWRALTWIEGATVDHLDSAADAEAAGELVGRFHRALADLEHQFAFARAGVHDTPAHLARLRDALERPAPGEDEIAAEARALGREILAAAGGLPELAGLPRRVCHGDLKISNVLFSSDEPHRARCLIDLDTLGMQTIAFELGDALRSWCNPSGEDVEAAGIDTELFEASVTGYAAGAAGLLEPRELASVVPGLETVCVELSARFCRDVFDDSYFGWDPTRFGSRREHNLVRARGQLALARSVRADRTELAKLLENRAS